MYSRIDLDPAVGSRLLFVACWGRKSEFPVGWVLGQLYDEKMRYTNPENRKDRSMAFS